MNYSSNTPVDTGYDYVFDQFKFQAGLGENREKLVSCGCAFQGTCQCHCVATDIYIMQTEKHCGVFQEPKCFSYQVKILWESCLKKEKKG